MLSHFSHVIVSSSFSRLFLCIILKLFLKVNQDETASEYVRETFCIAARAHTQTHIHIIHINFSSLILTTTACTDSSISLVFVHFHTHVAELCSDRIYLLVYRYHRERKRNFVDHISATLVCGTIESYFSDQAGSASNGHNCEPLFTSLRTL